MELEYLINALILKYSIKNPDIQTLNYFDKVNYLEQKEYSNMAEVAYFFRQFQSLVRLFGQEQTKIDSLPMYIQERILKTFKCNSISEFLIFLETQKSLVLSYINQFFSKQNIDADKKLKFKPVNWKN